MLNMRRDKRDTSWRQRESLCPSLSLSLSLSVSLSLWTWIDGHLLHDANNLYQHQLTLCSFITFIWNVVLFSKCFIIIFNSSVFRNVFLSYDYFQSIFIIHIIWNAFLLYFLLTYSSCLFIFSIIFYIVIFHFSLLENVFFS